MVIDVALQVRQHLPRDAQFTVTVIDEYCADYQELFPDVRSYECFKYLHLGLISDIPRKSLPEIAKIVGLPSSQSLHHLISDSPWSIKELRHKRLTRTRDALKGAAIAVIVDEDV